MIGYVCPVLARLLSCSFENNSIKATILPAATECFDILSPFPGDSDVMSHVERDSSKDRNIAARLVWMAVVGISGLSIAVSSD